MFHLIYYLSKQFLNEFIVSNAGFKSSLMQRDVHFVNYGLISSKTDDYLRFSLGCRLGSVFTNTIIGKIRGI